MKISTIKKMEKLMDKLSEEVQANLHPFESREVSPEDEVLIHNINAMLSAANESMIDLKIRNKSAASKIQRKITERILTERPQYRNMVTFKSPMESTVLIVFKDQLFGADLDMNDMGEYANENHEKILSEAIFHRTRHHEDVRDNSLDQELSETFGPAGVKAMLEFACWGERGTGLSMNLVFGKNFSKEDRIDQNVESLVGIILRYLDRLSTRFN